MAQEPTQIPQDLHDILSCLNDLAREHELSQRKRMASLLRKALSYNFPLLHKEIRALKKRN